MSNEIRLVLVDDHPILRHGLRQIIERESDLLVVAEDDEGEAALRSISELRPDVVVLDVDMPRMNGFEVLRSLNETDAKVGVIMLTVHREEEFFNEALRLGARGYVLKDTAIEDIVGCVRAVAAGDNYVSPAMTKYLFKSSVGGAKSTTGIAALTTTEKTILQLVADYKTNAQIADELFISPHTVKTHRKNICIKLDLEGNHALMKFALEHKAAL